MASIAEWPFFERDRIERLQTKIGDLAVAGPMSGAISTATSPGKTGGGREVMNIISIEDQAHRSRQHSENPVNARESRKGAFQGDLRHADARVEILDAGAFRKRRDFASDASAILPWSGDAIGCTKQCRSCHSSLAATFDSVFGEIRQVETFMGRTFFVNMNEISRFQQITVDFTAHLCN